MGQSGLRLPQHRLVLGLILVLSGIKYAIRAVAWAAAFFPDERQSWSSLFRSFLAGEALNYLSVAGPLVGEPAKASLLRGIRFAPGLASTLLETAVNTMTAIAITVTGMTMLVLWYAPGNALRYGGYVAILFLLAIACGFVFILKCRVPFLTGPYRRWGHRLGASSEKLSQNVTLIENRMHRLASERPGALWLIVVLDFAAQGLALLEIYAVLIPLGITLSLATVLVMEGFTKLTKAVLFFVPARIGAEEGSTAGIFTLLDFAPGTGVTLAIARRLRAVFWSALGLVILFGYGVSSSSGRSQAEV